VATAKSVLETLRPRAEAELAALLAQPYEKLVALPEVQSTEITGQPKDAKLSTYRDVLADGRVQVVVQLFVRGWLGSARIWAKGFFLRRGEAPVNATDDQLYAFF
jgi:hypothetical protein